MTYIPKAVSIYLNRLCPRCCPYCNVVNPEMDKKKLTVSEWKQIFNYLKDFGVEFYLILASEPLLLEDLVELVKHWKKLDIEYGFYTTAPEPWYSKYKDKLVKVGIRNWSSGIDFIDEVYYNGQWSNFTHELVRNQEAELVRKARESTRAMIEMQHYVEEVLALITVSRMNIEMISDMVKWLVENIPEIHIGINFVEYSPEEKMDFAKSKDLPFFFTENDVELLENLSRSLKNLPTKFKNHIQTPLDYFDNINYILNLNRKCALRTLAMGIDCDGSIRLCGYKKLDKKVSVYDFMKKPNEVLEVVEENWRSCKGCYWAYPYILEKYGVDGVNFRSEFWRERLCQSCL